MTESPEPEPTASRAHGTAAGPLYDQGYINTMVHFYRGELGRIMSWRQRLDTTTTWAITSTTTIFTVAFTVPAVPHIIFFFNIAIVWIMLWIEARRYRFYDAFRARVRMLEAHFLLPMVLQSKSMLQGDWQKLVCEDLLLPSFKISRFEAIGRRLKRNYSFIFILILIAWLAKIFLHAKYYIGKEHIETPIDFYHALKVAGFPAWFVAFIFVATFLTVIGVNVYISRKTTGEISEFGTHRTLWRI